MPDHTPARWGDPFRLDPASAASLADALAATPDARSGPRWDSCPVPAPIRQQLRRMVAAQLLADRARRRALGLLQRAAAAIATAQLFGSVRLYRPRHRPRRIRPGVVPGVVRVRGFRRWPASPTPHRRAWPPCHRPPWLPRL